MIIKYKYFLTYQNKLTTIYLIMTDWILCIHTYYQHFREANPVDDHLAKQGHPLPMGIYKSDGLPTCVSAPCFSDCNLTLFMRRSR